MRRLITRMPPSTRGMQPLTDPTESEIPRLAIIPSAVLIDQRRLEIELLRQIERQPALDPVARALRRIEADLHSDCIYETFGLFKMPTH